MVLFEKIIFEFISSGAGCILVICPSHPAFFMSDELQGVDPPTHAQAYLFELRPQVQASAWTGAIRDALYLDIAILLYTM